MSIFLARKNHEFIAACFRPIKEVTVTCFAKVTVTFITFIKGDGSDQRESEPQSTTSALAATQIATWIVVTLALFAILIDVICFF